MVDYTLRKDRKQNSVVDVTCCNCKISTKHKILTDISVEGHEKDEQGRVIYYWNDEYQIIQCQGCENVSFRRTHEDSCNYDQTGKITDVYIYPKPEKVISPFEMLDVYILPENCDASTMKHLKH